MGIRPQEQKQEPDARELFPTDRQAIIDRFRALERIAPAETYRGFQSNELADFRAYSDLCHSLSDRELFTRGIKCKFQSSEASDSLQHLEHAGDDQLRSAMMDFRLIFGLSQEPTHFERILDLARDGLDVSFPSSETARTELELLRENHKGALEAEAMLVGSIEDGSDKVVSISADDVVRDWMSSGKFHGDRKGAKERVDRWAPDTYEYCLIKVVNRMLNVYLALCVLIDGILASQGESKEHAAI